MNCIFPYTIIIDIKFNIQSLMSLQYPLMLEITGFSNYLTPLRKFFIEILTDSWLIKKFSAFYRKPNVQLPRSQEPVHNPSPIHL